MLGDTEYLLLPANEYFTCSGSSGTVYITNKDVPVYLFALGVGFPDTGTGVRTANYMVNMVELKNWMDPDEEDDE